MFKVNKSYQMVAKINLSHDLNKHSCHKVTNKWQQVAIKSNKMAKEMSFRKQ